MKKSIIIAVIAVAVAVPAGVYAASPLFINTAIDEPLPEAADDQMVEDAAMADKSGDSMMEKDGMMANDAMMEKEQLSGSFVGAGDGIHNARGAVKVIHLGDVNSVLRLENLRVTNGPDLHVYLATDTGASEYVDLGRLKANSGNQNYDIPEGTDLSKYDTVLVWCQAFSVLFGSAELASGMSI